MKKLMSLVILMALAGFCSIAYAIDNNATAGDQAQAPAVKNPEGEYLGTVRDVFVNYSGTVAFIIISVGENGEKEIAVPLVIFSYDKENEVLILKMSKEQINGAPEFNVRKVYEFFGVALPLTDEAPQDGGGEVN